MLAFTKTFHQTLAILTVIMNELSLGLGSGWVAPTLKLLQSSQGPFSLTIEDASWIASLDHMGKMVGAVLASLLLDVIGRKTLLFSCALIFFLQFSLILFGNSVLLLYVARIAFGVAFGINDSTNSVYLGENCSPLIRGIFGAIIISLNFFGLMFELALATYLSYQTTAVINSALAFLCLLSVLWMKEPVQFLLMKGKFKKAEKNFAWLRGVKDVNEVKGDFEKIKQNVNDENGKTSSIRVAITSPANYKSVLIMFTIYALAASTGYYPMICFASMSFAKTDLLTQNELTVIMGCYQFVIVTMASFILNRFNRRAVIITSFSLIAFFHAFTSLTYFIHENVCPVPYFPWLIFIGILSFIGIHAFVYPAIFLIRSELFPLSIKAVGGCISIVGYGALSFLTTKMYLYVSHFYGFYLNFAIFSVISLILVIFVYYVLPETRNKTLIEIQENLERRK